MTKLISYIAIFVVLGQQAESANKLFKPFSDLVAKTFRTHYSPSENSKASQQLMAAVIFQAGGTYVGNGGDVAICETANGTTYTMLDILEGEQYLTYPKNRWGGKTHFEIAGDVLFQMRTMVPARVQSYLQKLHQYEKENQISLRTEKLVDLPDSSVTVIPENCNIDQVALQLQDRDFEGKKIYVAAKYWKRMNELSRAALLVHEIVTEDFFLSGHRNSFFSRKLVAALFSQEFVEFTKKNIFSHSQELQEVLGLLFYDLFGLKSHPFKGLNVMTLPETFSQASGRLKINFKGPYEIKMRKYHLKYQTPLAQVIDYQGFPERLVGNEMTTSAKLVVEMNNEHAIVIFPKIIELKKNSNGLEIRRLVLNRSQISEIVQPSPLTAVDEVFFTTKYFIQVTPTAIINFTGMRPLAIPVRKGAADHSGSGSSFDHLFYTPQTSSYDLCEAGVARNTNCVDSLLGRFDW